MHSAFENYVFLILTLIFITRILAVVTYSIDPVTEGGHRQAVAEGRLAVAEGR